MTKFINELRTKKILIIDFITYRYKKLLFFVYAFSPAINKWSILSILFSLIKFYMLRLKKSVAIQN